MSSRIETLFADFVRHGVYLRGWSKTTVRTYNQALTSFQLSSPEGSIPTKAELETWIIWLREKGVTPGGVNMYVRTMNSFLTWLHSEGLTDSKLKLKLLPNPAKPLRGFSDNEIRSLLSFRPRGRIQFRTWTLVVTLLDTGIRINEALTLRAAELDLENLTLKVMGKGNKLRLVPFSVELRKSLFKYQIALAKQTPGVTYVFGTRHNGKVSYRNIYRDIKSLCKKVGVEGEHVHPHAFRHAFAVCYIRRGGDIYRLSRILGHTNISTTQIYLRSMGIEHLGENHSSLSPLSRG